MYLSRVELDPIRRSTMAALAAPQKLHGAVESAFTGERRRRLWRLDRLGERLYLLLLSEDVPELSGVVEQFGTSGVPIPYRMNRLSLNMFEHSYIQLYAMVDPLHQYYTDDVMFRQDCRMEASI